MAGPSNYRQGIELVPYPFYQCEAFLYIARIISLTISGLDYQSMSPQTTLDSSNTLRQSSQLLRVTLDLVALRIQTGFHVLLRSSMITSDRPMLPLAIHT
jgi:hypothetical protein